MKEIQLPTGILYICSICGRTNRNPETLSMHEAIMPFPSLPLGQPVHRGTCVQLYESCWQGTHAQRRFTGMTEQPTWWSVIDLFFAQEEARDVLGNRGLWEVHELCLVFQQTVENDASRPWTPKDGTMTLPYSPTLDAQEGAIRRRTLSYHQFLLWQKGSRSNLEAAGLVQPLPSAPPSESWTRKIFRPIFDGT